MIGKLSFNGSLLVVVLAIVWSFGGCSATNGPPPELVDRLLEDLKDHPGPVHVFTARADLDDDGRPEWIVHVAGPAVCGTGGCVTLVYTTTRGELRLVARVTVSRPPIVVAETSTEGWRDLIVRASGGGLVSGHDARLRYDGETYASNPTVAPAERLPRPVPGRVAIPVFRSLIEGVRLPVEGGRL